MTMAAIGLATLRRIEQRVDSAGNFSISLKLQKALEQARIHIIVAGARRPPLGGPTTLSWNCLRADTIIGASVSVAVASM
jgi:hypothetical protein